MKCIKCNLEKEEQYFEFRKDIGKRRNVCRSCSKGYKTLRTETIDQNQSRFQQGLKKCSKCLEVKDLSNFGKDKYTKHGYSSICKSCITEKSSLESTKRANKNSKLKLTYGITIEEFDNMMKKQDSKCKICNSDISKKGEANVDHCHTNGYVRGLLCFNCNIGLGMFKDNLSLLKNAIKYLK